MGLAGVIFDFGGVLLRTPFELGDLEAAGPFGHDPLWGAMQDGELTEREYWQRQGAAAGTTVAELLSGLFDGPEEQLLRPGAAELVADVRAAGLRCVILTNDLGVFHGDDWIAQMTILRAVDGVVDLSRTAMLKPDPRAYRRALDRIGLPADQVLFVDDQPANLEGARRAGLAVEPFDVTDPTGSFVRIRARLRLRSTA